MTLSTKDKILEIATELFANKGFKGTSIRDIASLADVNLSAVNYHFQNKELLYLEVFMKNHSWIETNANKLAENSNLTTSEFTWLLLQFFNNNSKEFLNTFKILLDDGIDLKSFKVDSAFEFSPPGEAAFMRIIEKDIGIKVPEEGRLWAMRMLLSNIVHTTVFATSNIIMESSSLKDCFTEAEQKKNITFLVEAVLDYLKKNPSNWEAK